MRNLCTYSQPVPSHEFESGTRIYPGQANYLFDVSPPVVQNNYVEEDVSGGEEVPDHFSTPEVLDNLNDYHFTLYAKSRGKSLQARVRKS